MRGKWSLLTNNQISLLSTLIQKYENKNDYGKDKKNHQRISMRVSTKNFPLYFHDSESKYRIELNQEALDLQSKKYIEIKWVRFSEGEEIQTIYLNEDTLSDCYQALGIQSKADKYHNIRQLVEKFAVSCPEPLQVFYGNVLECLKSYQSLPSVIDMDSIDNTNNNLLGLNSLLQERDYEIPRRKWSIQLYNDSKKWEKIESKIVSVVKKYVYKDMEMDDKEILIEWGIVDNPQLIYIYGPITFYHQNHIIDLSLFTNSFGLDTNFIEAAVITELKTEAVVTVENLTSYYEYIDYVKTKQLNYTVIYLGGFHNSIRRLLLLKIVEFMKKKQMNITFYHWGDIDLGGMRIWKHLSDKINIPITPLFMGVEMYTTHVLYGKPIETKTYIKSLEKLLDNRSFDIFHEVIQLIIEYGKTIEQEIITLLRI